MLILTLMHVNPSTSKCLYPCAGNKQVYLKFRGKKTQKKKKKGKEEFKVNTVMENTTLRNQLMLLCYAFACDTWLENCTKKLLYFHSFAVA